MGSPGPAGSMLRAGGGCVVTDVPWEVVSGHLSLCRSHL